MQVHQGTYDVGCSHEESTDKHEHSKHTCTHCNPHDEVGHHCADGNHHRLSDQQSQEQVGKENPKSTVLQSNQEIRCHRKDDSYQEHEWYAHKCL